MAEYLEISVDELKKKIDNLDELINKYTLEANNTNNKSYEFFITQLIDQKHKIQEMLNPL